MGPSSAQNPSDSDPLLENQHVDSPSSSSESSSEIKNDDVEAGSVVCCRICLECDGEEGLILMLRLSFFCVWVLIILSKLMIRENICLSSVIRLVLCLHFSSLDRWCGKSIICVEAKSLLVFVYSNNLKSFRKVKKQNIVSWIDCFRAKYTNDNGEAGSVMSCCICLRV